MAPIPSAYLVNDIASSVELEPVPAKTEIFPLDSLTHNSITLSCSLWFKVGDSPVVPAGTSPDVPLLKWWCIKEI